MNKNLEKVKLELLKGRTWKYLRYQHARQALELMSDWKDVLIIGAGSGLVEVALALEFPNKLFHLTSREDAANPFKAAKVFVEAFDLKNVSFGTLDILKPYSMKFDVVYSVEILGYIEDDDRAASNMRMLSNRYVFCLVPFAQDSLNDDAKKRKRAYEKHQQFVLGYDVKRLVSLFPNPIAIRGCYWQDAGVVFRQKLMGMDIESIVEKRDELIDEASNDIRDRIQARQGDASGIWIVSEVESAQV